MINYFSFKVCPFVQRILLDIETGNCSRRPEWDTMYKWDHAAGEMVWYMGAGLVWGVYLSRGDEKVPLTFYEHYLLSKKIKEMRQAHEKLCDEEAKSRPNVRS